MNQNLSSAEARNCFPDLVNQATYAKKRTVITKRGKRVAAIVPIEDLDYLQSLEDARDKKMIEDTLKTGEFVDWEIAKKELLASHGISEAEFKKIVEMTKNIQAED